jgi:hypothetical protein
LFDPGSFVRVVAFALVFAGIEYRYVNRFERDPAGGVFAEKPVFWVVTPYHAFLLLPMFIVVAYSSSVGAWAGNTFFLAVIEDVAYFAWRGRSVVEGEWTTTLFGSFKVGGLVVPVWWPLDSVVAAALFLLPF